MGGGVTCQADRCVCVSPPLCVSFRCLNRNSDHLCRQARLLIGSQPSHLAYGNRGEAFKKEEIPDLLPLSLGFCLLLPLFGIVVFQSWILTVCGGRF